MTEESKLVQDKDHVIALCKESGVLDFSEATGYFAGYASHTMSSEDRTAMVDIMTEVAPDVRTIDCSGNDLDNVFAKHFAKMISNGSYTQLQVLQLEHNKFTDKGITYLITKLASSPIGDQIQEMYLEYQLECTGSSSKALLEFANGHKNLVKVTFDYQGSADRSIVEQVLAQNQIQAASDAVPEQIQDTNSKPRRRFRSRNPKRATASPSPSLSVPKEDTDKDDEEKVIGRRGRSYKKRASPETRDAATVMGNVMKRMEERTAIVSNMIKQGGNAQRRPSGVHRERVASLSPVIDEEKVEIEGREETEEAQRTITVGVSQREPRPVTRRDLSVESRSRSGSRHRERVQSLVSNELHPVSEEADPIIAAIKAVAANASDQEEPVAEETHNIDVAHSSEDISVDGLVSKDRSSSIPDDKEPPVDTLQENIEEPVQDESTSLPLNAKKQTEEIRIDRQMSFAEIDDDPSTPLQQQRVLEETNTSTFSLDPSAAKLRRLSVRTTKLPFLKLPSIDVEAEDSDGSGEFLFYELPIAPFPYDPVLHKRERPVSPVQERSASQYSIPRRPSRAQVEQRKPSAIDVAAIRRMSALSASERHRFSTAAHETVFEQESMPVFDRLPTRQSMQMDTVSIRRQSVMSFQERQRTQSQESVFNADEQRRLSRIPSQVTIDAASFRRLSTMNTSLPENRKESIFDDDASGLRRLSTFASVDIPEMRRLSTLSRSDRRASIRSRQSSIHSLSSSIPNRSIPSIQEDARSETSTSSDEPCSSQQKPVLEAKPSSESRSIESPIQQHSERVFTPVSGVIGKHRQQTLRRPLTTPNERTVEKPRMRSASASPLWWWQASGDSNFGTRRKELYEVSGECGLLSPCSDTVPILATCLGEEHKDALDWNAHTLVDHRAPIPEPAIDRVSEEEASEHASCDVSESTSVAGTADPIDEAPDSVVNEPLGTSAECNTDDQDSSDGQSRAGSCYCGVNQGEYSPCPSVSKSLESVETLSYAETPVALDTEEAKNDNGLLQTLQAISETLKQMTLKSGIRDIHDDATSVHESTETYTTIPDFTPAASITAHDAEDIPVVEDTTPVHVVLDTRDTQDTQDTQEMHDTQDDIESASIVSYREPEFDEFASVPVPPHLARRLQEEREHRLKTARQRPTKVRQTTEPSPSRVEVLFKVAPTEERAPKHQHRHREQQYRTSPVHARNHRRVAEQPREQRHHDTVPFMDTVSRGSTANPPLMQHKLPSPDREERATTSTRKERRVSQTNVPSPGSSSHRHVVEPPRKRLHRTMPKKLHTPRLSLPGTAPRLRSRGEQESSTSSSSMMEETWKSKNTFTPDPKKRFGVRRDYERITPKHSLPSTTHRESDALSWDSEKLSLFEPEPETAATQKQSQHTKTTAQTAPISFLGLLYSNPLQIIP